ncbi:MAG: hypothetical protein R3252_08350 [Robiginitalea sp.]|nr:hypothetical protein [Robiginitalea sp.]
MLHFFRKIRQNVIADRRFSKYLLYAIGEILLVVIGILIALQVDAWQQRQAEGEQEAYYLARLEGELEANINIARELEAFKDFQHKNALLVLGFLTDTAPKEEAGQDFFLALEHLTWLYKRNFQKDVWEELQFTGNIDLISDRALRTRLSHMYNALDFYSSFEEEWETYTMGYRRLLGNANVFSFETRRALTHALRPWGAEGVVGNLPDYDTTITRLRQLTALPGYLSDIILSSETGSQQHSMIARNIDSLLKELKTHQPIK